MSRPSTSSVPADRLESFPPARPIPIEVDMRRTKNDGRRLPRWLWLIIAHSLGIKTKENQRTPIIATLLYISTVLFGFGWFVTTSVYTLYNIASEDTNTDMIDGSCSILLTLGCILLGVSSNKLAFKLFSHVKFRSMLRLHAKSILKLNAAVVVALLMCAFAVINNINAYVEWQGSPCESLKIFYVVCRARYICQVVFSFFAVLWNAMVATVLISVCRTHTIGIRIFIHELEDDALLYEEQLQTLDGDRPLTRKDIAEEYLWQDDAGLDYTQLEEYRTPPRVPMRHVSFSQRPIVANGANPSDSSEVEEDPTPGKRTTSLTNAEILHRYWKISTSLRFSSVAFEQWTISVMGLGFVWSVMYLVYWLNHKSTLLQVADFLIPLLLMPIFASAYAEVNNEGFRMLRCIRPNVERLPILNHMFKYPLQMTVWSYALGYSVILTALVGLIIACLSRILLKEFRL